MLLAAPRSDVIDMIGDTVMCRVVRVDEGRVEDDHAGKQVRVRQDLGWLCIA